MISWTLGFCDFGENFSQVIYLRKTVRKPTSLTQSKWLVNLVNRWKTAWMPFMYSVVKTVLIPFVRWERNLEFHVDFLFGLWLKMKSWNYEFNSQPEIRTYLAISFLQRLNCKVDNYNVKYQTNNSQNNQ